MKNTPMPVRTLAALKKSIAHWTRVSTGKAREAENITRGSCALCDLFYFRSGTRDGLLFVHCYGCPVSAKTGRIQCVDTPYSKAYAALQRPGIGFPDFTAQTKTFYRHARAELAFLKSLLPPK